MTKRKSDEELVGAAARKAASDAFFNANPGKEFTINEVAEAIGHERRDVAYTLKNMTLSGELNERRVGVSNVYSKGVPTVETQVDGVDGEVRRKGRGKATQEVELVFGKTLIVIGRNKITNRLRIELEDLS